MADNDVVLYTVKDIRVMFHCGRDKAYNIMRSSGFPSFRIENTLYVEKGELIKWIDRQRKERVIEINRI